MEYRQPSDALSKPNKRNHTRGTAVRAFTGFIDDDDDEKFVDLNTDGPALVSRSQHEVSAVEAEATQDEPGPTQLRKRRAPSVVDDEDNEQLFPAQAAMKRRRLEEEKEAQQNGRPPRMRSEDSQAAKPVTKPKKVKQFDVQRAIQKQRKAEEEAEEDQEPIQEILENMSVEDMQNLAIVEEMNIAERRGAARSIDEVRNGRWDERWNGRKNFKQFRRKGQQEPTRRGPAIIIPLEEVKNTTFGIRDDFFAQREKVRVVQRKRVTEEREDMTDHSQTYADAASHQEEVPAELANDDEPQVIDVDAPRTTRRSERAGIRAPSVQSQATLRKRPASRSGAASTVKRQKKLSLVADADEGGSDEEEATKFRFRKRR